MKLMASMNKMSVLIVGFITVLVGVIFLSSLADNESTIRTLVTVTDDAFTGSNSTCTRVATGCIDSLTTVENATGAMTVGAANYSLCRSTTGVQDGILLAANSQAEGITLGGAALNATYEQSPGCMYVASGVSRTFIGLIIVFFAIFVLLIAVGVFTKSKEGAF